MIDSVIDLFPGEIPDWIMNSTDRQVNGWVDAFPSEYGAELRGIATATGIDLGKLFLFNIAFVRIVVEDLDCYPLGSPVRGGGGGDWRF